MRYLVLIIVLAFVSCSKPSTTENKTAGDTTNQISAAPVVETKIDSSGVYVGFANYFEETKEFYVSLYFADPNDEISNSDFGDSIVFKDGDGYLRKFIPMPLARKHFILHGLDTLRLYNVDHQHLGTANLLRVEYVEEMITTQYVAVYKFAHAYNDRYGPYYAISDRVGEKVEKDFSTIKLIDGALNAIVIGNLNLYRADPSGRIYSTVNFGDQALIVETFNDDSKIMATETDGYHYGIALPIPIMLKGKPILLVSYHQSEGDASGDYVMAFSGDKFEAVKGARVGE
jgi:hypothetical protein